MTGIGEPGWRQRPRVAAIVTEYRPRSHADVLVTKLLEGYTLFWTPVQPRVEVVSLYTDQVTENDISREIARKLRGTRGVSVELTRDDDTFLPLADRVAIAREAGADLFISIHADSAPNRDARGLSAYTLSDKASDDFSFALAKQENLADGAGGIDLRHTRPLVAAILSDLVARHTVSASLMAKSSLVEGAGRALRLLDNPKRSANFAVLKSPDVPSVLIETGFLSNERDEELLRDQSQRRRIADVLSRELAEVLTSAPFA